MILILKMAKISNYQSQYYRGVRMRDKINKQFIKGMQGRLNEKNEEYGGKDNPKNYRNLPSYALFEMIDNDVQELLDYYDEMVSENLDSLEKENIMEKLIDIANRCGMLWEKLKHTK